MKEGIKPSLADKFAQTTQAIFDQVTFKQFSKLNRIIYFSFFFQIRLWHMGYGTNDGRYASQI